MKILSSQLYHITTKDNSGYTTCRTIMANTFDEAILLASKVRDKYNIGEEIIEIRSGNKVYYSSTKSFTVEI